MNKDIEYTKIVNTSHIKTFGQYFTNKKVADFMCSWACRDAATMLDPAVGNSVFLTSAKKQYPSCNLCGYEIDPVILDYFGNPSNAVLINDDYLGHGWDKKYDAIVCNPPYSRFQAISNRDSILKTIFRYTGTKYSAYTNLYILFLIKSIYQLSPNGRIAYIIPTEFLNSDYGIPIKQKLLEEHLLYAIINFENDNELFSNAITTSCILLLDHSEKTKIRFFNLKTISELDRLNDINDSNECISVPYSDISADEKWRSYLKHEKKNYYSNLISISKYCKISRGIATGANSFFCLSKSKIEQNKIPYEAVSECICHSADVKSYIFNRSDFDILATSDKSVYLLDIKDSNNPELQEYIKHGEEKNINKRYLLSCRTPWYSMEQKPIAPIWVSSACRDGIKFVRNLAGIKSLTTFHSVFVNDLFLDYTDVIFCYFLTPIAQEIIRENRKELGNGLEKFQPNDLKNAEMLNISVIDENDLDTINTIYQEMVTNYNPGLIERLNNIFRGYLIE